MKLLILLLLFSENLWANIQLDKTIYEKMNYNPQYAKEGALTYNVNFKVIKSLKKQIEQQDKVRLQTRGEAHITIITPPEYNGPKRNKENQLPGLKKYLQMEEILNRFEKKLQNLNFKVGCIGKLTNKKNTVYYLVLNSPELSKVRQEILAEATRRAKWNNQNHNFESLKWYPHITIGFTKADIHNQPKEITTCKNTPRLFTDPTDHAPSKVAP